MISMIGKDVSHALTRICTTHIEVLAFRIYLGRYFRHCLQNRFSEESLLSLECVKMAMIYAHAKLTLAGSSGRGLLPTTPPYHVSDFCMLNYSNGSGALIGRVKVRSLRDTRHHTQPNFSLPLNYRAWTLQEYLLSTRVLGFDDDKMWWVCTASRLTESLHVAVDQWACDDENTPLKKAFRTRNPGKLYKWYQTVLNNYCHRQLTFPADRLPALFGIASII